MGEGAVCCATTGVCAGEGEAAGAVRMGRCPCCQSNRQASRMTAKVIPMANFLVIRNKTKAGHEVIEERL